MNLDRLLLYREDACDRVFLAIIKALLKQGNKPCTPRELSSIILKNNLATLGGATPYATVSSRISQHFRRAKRLGREPLLGSKLQDGSNTRRLVYYVKENSQQQNPVTVFKDGKIRRVSTVIFSLVAGAGVTCESAAQFFGSQRRDKRTSSKPRKEKKSKVPDFRTDSSPVEQKEHLTERCCEEKYCSGLSSGSLVNKSDCFSSDERDITPASAIFNVYSQYSVSDEDVLDDKSKVNGSFFFSPQGLNLLGSWNNCLDNIIEHSQSDSPFLEYTDRFDEPIGFVPEQKPEAEILPFPKVHPHDDMDLKETLDAPQVITESEYVLDRFRLMSHTHNNSTFSTYEADLMFGSAGLPNGPTRVAQIVTVALAPTIILPLSFVIVSSDGSKRYLDEWPKVQPSCRKIMTTLTGYVRARELMLYSHVAHKQKNSNEEQKGPKTRSARKKEAPIQKVSRVALDAYREELMCRLLWSPEPHESYAVCVIEEDEDDISNGLLITGLSSESTESNSGIPPECQGVWIPAIDAVRVEPSFVNFIAAVESTYVNAYRNNDFDISSEGGSISELAFSIQGKNLVPLDDPELADCEYIDGQNENASEEESTNMENQGNDGQMPILKPNNRDMMFLKSCTNGNGWPMDEMDDAPCGLTSCHLHNNDCNHVLVRLVTVRK